MRIGVVLALFVAAAVPAGVAVAASISTDSAASHRGAAKRDRGATLAYLRAQLSYEKARVAAAPTSREAVEALASRLDGECPAVVAGVKQSMKRVAGPRSARREGEEARKRQQWSDLTVELNRAIGLAELGPYRQAALAFARKTRTLRWSDRMLTAFEHANARAIEWEVDGVRPPVCADMRAWVRSGYTRLAASTLALISRREAADRPLLRIVERLFSVAPAGGLFSDPVARYEGRRAKALSRRLAGVIEHSERGVLSPVFAAGERIRIALGVSTEAELNELKKFVESSNKRSPIPKGAVVIGKGRTTAGNSYTIWTRSRGRHGGKTGLLGALSIPSDCRREVGILEIQRTVVGVTFEVSGEPRMACLSGAHPIKPRVRCAGPVRTVEAQTPADARRVRLTLTDGRQITSRVAVLPHRLGDPVGFYYQALQVWVSPPVSFTELTGRGRPLRTVRLAHVPKCPAQWPFIPHGSVRRVAGGRVPGGSRFSIIANRAESSGATEPSLWVEVAGKRSFGGFGHGGGPFTWQMQAACRPHQYAILYGILKNARDTVWVRDSAGLTQLRRARIPASLHAHGVLAYAALPAVPSELVIRAPGGQTLNTRKLSAIARRARETCEGEAEPSG